MGRWIQIVGATLLSITAFFEKERPALGSVLNMLIVGFFIDLIIDSGLIPSPMGMAPRTALLIGGIVLLGTGSGMYVSSRLGAGPRDGVMLLMAKRFSISVRLARTLLEIMALVLGWMAGGPVAFGTFISVPLIGPVTQLSLKFFTKQLEKL